MLNFFSLPYYEIKLLHIFTSQSNNSIGFPDWSKAELVVSYYPTNYTAPDDGFVWIHLASNLANRQYIYINDKQFYAIYESHDASGASSQFFVCKGDKIRSSTANELWIHFVPLK